MAAEHVENVKQWENRCKSGCKWLQLCTCNLFGGTNIPEDLEAVARVLAQVLHHEVIYFPSDLCCFVDKVGLIGNVGFGSFRPCRWVDFGALFAAQQRSRGTSATSQFINPPSDLITVKTTIGGEPFARGGNQG